MKYKKLIFTLFVVSVVFAGAKLTTDRSGVHSSESGHGHVHDEDGNHIEEGHAGHSHDGKPCDGNHANDQDKADHSGHAHDEDGNHIDDDHAGHTHDGKPCDGNHVEEDSAAHTHDGEPCDGDHGASQDEADHAHEALVELPKEDIKRFGIEVCKAGAGEFDVHVNVAGEIKLNSDRLAHIVPRVGGIVKEVKKTLGDKVEKGQVMAVIESRTLADAKTTYLASLERLELAKVTFDREDRLRKEKVSSEQDYLNARNVFAEAGIAMRSAEQKLRALGYDKERLAKLPNEPKEMLISFEITAPFSGTVIKKHITLGELIKDGMDVFVVADLDTVWVDLQIHQKDIAFVRKGQSVAINAKHLPEMKGVIAYVEPVLDDRTRTALARVVLDNKSGMVRPGTFVTAEVTVDSPDSKLVVDKAILQEIEDETCVFVQDAHGFEARPVVVGRRNDTKVEILSGLKPGETIVIKNPFRLKAELEKSEDAGCSSHGHAH